MKLFKFTVSIVITEFNTQFQWWPRYITTKDGTFDGAFYSGERKILF